MRRAATKILKAKVFVWGARERGDEHNHATLNLYIEGDNQSWLEVTFQRHLLLGGGGSGFRSEPNPQLDFGEPWCHFYGAHVTSRFDAEYSGPRQMVQTARFIERVQKRISGRNLRSYNACSLTQWIQALESMKVQVELERGMPGLPDLNPNELPERQRRPAARYLEALRGIGEMAQ